MKHVHHDCIVAWAKGHRIEWYDRSFGKWKLIPKDANINWFPDGEYRVASAKPIDMYFIAVVSEDGNYATLYSPKENEAANLKLSFDVVNNKLLKAEVL